MKKFTAVLALLLLLTGCGTPASELSPTPEVSAPPSFSQPSGVYADWSRLAKPAVPEKVGTRLSEGALTELTPSDSYGPLVPYVGGVVMAEEYGLQQYQYGLVTLDGCVVLDPVLDNASVITNGSRYALLLSRRSGSEENTEERYALCASDGSWCTDFLYSSIYLNNDGYINLFDIRYDADGNYIGDIDHACIMDFDGNVVLNLSDIRPEVDLGDYRNDPDFQYDFMNLSEGFARVSLEDGRTVFMDYNGKLLQSDEFNGYFASAYAFVDGIACVQPQWGGPWGVIDSSGKWVLRPEYTDMSFMDGGGLIATCADGRKLLFSTKGEQLADLSGVDAPTAYKLNKGYLITDWSSDTIKGYDVQLNDLGLLEYPDVYEGRAVFKTVRAGQNGFVIYDGEEQIFVEGDYTQLEQYGGYITAVTADGEGALFSLDGEVLASLSGCEYGVYTVQDYATDTVYLAGWSGNNVTLVGMDGKAIVYPGGIGSGIIQGCYSLVDETGASVVNMDGTCIFRTSIDFTD